MNKEKILNFVKSKKFKVIVIVLIVVILAIIIINAISGSPEKTLYKMAELINEGNFSKIMDECVDLDGVYAFATAETKEDFWTTYKDLDESDDDYADYLDNIDNYLDDSIEELENDFEEEDYEVEIKEIKSSEKVSKNLYKVKAKIKAKSDDGSDTETFTFYFMKKGLKYYLVGGSILDNI